MSLWEISFLRRTKKTKTNQCRCVTRPLKTGLWKAIGLIEMNQLSTMSPTMTTVSFFSSKKYILCMYCNRYRTAGHRAVCSLPRQSRKDSDLKVHSGLHTVMPTFFLFPKLVCTANMTLAFNIYFDGFLCQNEMKWGFKSGLCRVWRLSCLIPFLFWFFQYVKVLRLEVRN